MPRSILGDTAQVFAVIDACTAILGRPVALPAQCCLDDLVPELLAPVFKRAHARPS